MDENNHKSQLNQSVFDLFRESFAKVCTESTSHGLPNVFKTKNWLIRILWLVLFLAGSGGALYCTNVFIFLSSLKINKKLITLIFSKIQSFLLWIIWRIQRVWPLKRLMSRQQNFLPSLYVNCFNSLTYCTFTSYPFSLKNI